MICKVDGCDKPARSRSKQLCSGHYHRLNRYGSPTGKPPPRPPKDRRCDLEGCDRPHHAHGLCNRHFGRKYRHGDPTAGGIMYGEALAYAKAIASHPSPGDECIDWPYGRRGKYGAVNYEGKQWNAHRLVLLFAQGPPPQPKMDAAHAPIICHNPLCVNPRHLRWATRSENMYDKTFDGTHWNQKPLEEQ